MLPRKVPRGQVTGRAQTPLPLTKARLEAALHYRATLSPWVGAAPRDRALSAPTLPRHTPWGPAGSVARPRRPSLEVPRVERERIYASWKESSTEKKTFFHFFRTLFWKGSDQGLECRKQDSNLHARRQEGLNLLCLPVPPFRHICPRRS